MKKILITIFLQLWLPICLAQSSEVNLPWWSAAAPEILKELDFSKVNGNADTYDIGTNYRLKKLSQQGRWSKMYVLEKTDSWSSPKIICAVKLLASRQNQHISVAEYRLRHWEEIKHTIQISNWDISVKPYGIIRNDQDHFLIFLQYASSAKDILIQQNLQSTLSQLNALIKEVNNMHSHGYAHGDIKLENFLEQNGRLKLCDWFSLTSNNQIPADKCHYAAAKIPNINIDAYYYDKNLGRNLQYNVITVANGRQVYWMHPISADRLSLGLSLLRFIAPELHEKIKETPKNFYLYSPLGLTYWPKHKNIILQVRAELITQLNSMQDKQSLKAKMLQQAIELINIEHITMLGKYV